MRLAPILLTVAACAELATTDDPSQLATKSCAGQIFCDDIEHAPSANPAFEYLVLGEHEQTPDGEVVFAAGGSAKRWSVRMVVAHDAAGTYADVVVRGRAFRVITHRTPTHARFASGVTILDAGARTLDAITLIETLVIDTSTQPLLGGGDLAVVETATQSTVTRAPFAPGLTATPGTCREKALVRFGPIPWNMYPLDFPEIESCSAERCISITEGWIRGHHHAWRINQMFAVLTAADHHYRSFLWGQPAIDWAGVAVGTSGSSTSPKHYFGEYNDDRFYAAREGVWQMMDVFVRARTIGSAVHLKCGDCSGYGKHSTIGWINVCSGAFADSANLYPNDQDAVTHTVIHEAMHWLSIDFDAGPRAIRDTITHGHGSACLSSVTTTYVDQLSEVRHLADYVASDGEDCWHQNLAVQSVEAYANFAMRIGEGVRDGELYRWPKLADPTPQPPECVGGEGCLCEEVPAGGELVSPDGDYSIDQHCSDNDGEMTCVETAVNAGAIVGICTRCEPERGIGCECDDSRPCNVGTCWGDDTHGGGTGRCYDDPPSWACLADCQRLFNDDQAWCFNNHLGGARCMDSGCPEPLATPCYEQGMICRDGACIVECESTADCDARGYPTYFECSSAGRCEYPF